MSSLILLEDSSFHLFTFSRHFNTGNFVGNCSSFCASLNESFQCSRCWTHRSHSGGSRTSGLCVASFSYLTWCSFVLQVASRGVVFISGAFMILLGIFAKLTLIFYLIPPSIITAIAIVTIGNIIIQLVISARHFLNC